MVTKDIFRRIFAIFIALNALCLLSLYVGVLIGFQFWPFLALWLVS
jgi:hypothetical protein